MEKNISRRRFLKNSAATSVSLIIGLNSKGILATNKTNTVINPFVRMDQEGFVTVNCKALRKWSRHLNGFSNTFSRRNGCRLGKGQSRICSCQC